MEENRDNLPKPQSMSKFREGLKKNLWLQLLILVAWVGLYTLAVSPAILEWFKKWRLITSQEMYIGLQFCIPAIGIVIPLVFLYLFRMKNRKNAMIMFLGYAAFVVVYLVAIEPSVSRAVQRHILLTGGRGAWAAFYGTKVMGFVIPLAIILVYSKLKICTKKKNNSGK